MLLVLSAASLLWAKTVARPQVAALLGAAQKAVKKKDLAAAKTSVGEALVALREQAPLTIRQAAIVSAPPQGLGLYTPAPGGVVKDRLVWMYLEVEGFLARGVGETRDISLTVVGDFAFEDGTALGQRELGTRRYATRTHESLDAFGLDLQLSDKAPAGAYTVQLLVTDNVSEKTARRTVTFTLPPVR